MGGLFKYAWILFALVAYPALGYGLFVLVSNTVFWGRATTAEGTVVGYEQMESMRGRSQVGVQPAYSNVVEFRSADGQRHLFVTEWGSAAAVYDKGERVTVLYRPEDPENAKIRGFVSLYVGPLLLLVLGAAMWVASVIFRIVGDDSGGGRRKRSRRRD